MPLSCHTTNYIANFSPQIEEMAKVQRKREGGAPTCPHWLQRDPPPRPSNIPYRLPGVILLTSEERRILE